MTSPTDPHAPEPEPHAPHVEPHDPKPEPHAPDAEPHATGSGPSAAGPAPFAAGPNPVASDQKRFATGWKPVAPGQEPFAAGREADVYALTGDTVLRRYRNGEDAEPEAAVMAHVARHGFPVPRVHSADGPDLVLERLDGPTMATALFAETIPLREGATMLADLLRRLHALPSLSGDSRSVIHLDLHPENVILTEDGPVVIDWRNAQDGSPDLDTAFTGLILAQVATGAIPHPIRERAGELLDLFLELAPGDPTRELDLAVRIRSGQMTLSADEIRMLPLAAARVRGVN